MFGLVDKNSDALADLADAAADLRASVELAALDVEHAGAHYDALLKQQDDLHAVLETNAQMKTQIAEMEQLFADLNAAISA